MTDILLLATAKYYQFVDQMITSIKKHIKFPNRIILLTDNITGREDCKEYFISHEPFPYITLFRYHYFNQIKDFSDYLFYVDVDARFVADVGEEILSDLVAVRHCGFYFKNVFPHEENPASPLYDFKFTKYYGGGFQGGKREHFLTMSKWCEAQINEALDRGLIPETSSQRYAHNKQVALRHHDETAMNCYLSIHPPTLELTPSFHFPEEIINRRPDWEEARSHFIDKCWNGSQPFEPKLILLKKNHEEIRK